MNVRKNRFELNLDPYTSSSLLQKAIRRGHVDYATEALVAYFRYRGKGIWRRLVTIAFEDVGVANVPLILEVLSSTSERDEHEQVRAAQALAAKMATSTKSRSTDHLYSCVALWLAANKEIPQSIAEFIDIAADPDKELILRGAALIAPVPGRTTIGAREAITRLDHLRTFLPEKAADLIDPTIAAFRIVKHPFLLLLPLIAAKIEESGVGTRTSEESMPPWADLNGVPSYVYDLHTYRGKRAAALLADTNADVATALLTHVIPSRHHFVTQMAAFYADATPLNFNLNWVESDRLEIAGRRADMLAAGCSPSGIQPVLDAVARNLKHLDALRCSLIMGRAGE